MFKAARERDRTPRPFLGLAGAALIAAVGSGRALPAPRLEERSLEAVITGKAYRAAIAKESFGLSLEIRGADGAWKRIAGPGAFSLGWDRRGHILEAGGARAIYTLEKVQEWIVLGQKILLDLPGGPVLGIHWIFSDAGILLNAQCERPGARPLEGNLWFPPRIHLRPEDWQGYLFWAVDGSTHRGRLGDLAPLPAYAGVSPWGSAGDTVPALSRDLPAIEVVPAAGGPGLAVVRAGPVEAWSGAGAFLQRHSQASLYFYCGLAPADAAAALEGIPAAGLWAWLAPLPEDPAAAAGCVRDLIREAEAIRADFRPLAPSLPESWTRPLSDFPAALKRPRPVEDLTDAMVFTVNEFTRSDREVDLARKVGSDLLIRGWFKWAQAPPVAQYRAVPEKIHALGALFGGGITCSALYDGENGISREDLLDMATRGPAGQLLDAWDTPGIRHGSLSNPRYLEYLLRWCGEQIDAGADVLFMDEHTAALGPLEGYDDHSLADFRAYLLEHCPRTRGWAPLDRRWGEDLGVNLADPRICASGDMRSFDFRGFLTAKGLIEQPASPGNPLQLLWEEFRAWRDDRAWKSLTDRIRTYAREKGRRVHLSANGIARYVDLQVLGIWGAWSTRDGHIDISEGKIPYWRSIVRRGHEAAGRPVPVVLFHDWGFGDPPFPWLAVPPSEREVWMRTRGAEIHAAGGFFAFPVLGPFGCDAGRDGTLGEIARQAAFYQEHRDLYLQARYLASEALESPSEDLSLAAAWHPGRKTILVHIVNRKLEAGRLVPRRDVVVRIPVELAPARAVLVSPDRSGERPAAATASDGRIELKLPLVEAYDVAILTYDRPPDLGRLKDPARTILAASWSRSARDEFALGPDGIPEGAPDLNGYLQGMLHQHLRRPPTFLLHAPRGGELLVKVRSVAAAGARIEVRVDGRPAAGVDLPDLDGRNDGDAREYDRILRFAIPAGRHRVTMDNVGPDWAVLSWIEFRGEFAPWAPD